MTQWPGRHLNWFPRPTRWSRTHQDWADRPGHFDMHLPEALEMSVGCTRSDRITDRLQMALDRIMGTGI